MPHQPTQSLEQVGTVTMSPSLDSAEAQWQSQLAAVRAALAELKLSHKDTNENSDPYVSDIKFVEDDDFSPRNSGDDVWDFISDDEEDIYSDSFIEDVIPDEEKKNYSPEWLKIQCLSLAARKQGLSGEDLEEQIMALLVSDSAEDELQSTLTDIIGLDDLDLVIELISHRKEITSTGPLVINKSDGIIGKLHTKRQREESLREQDYKHKHATLGPNLHRDEPQYPHVYSATKSTQFPLAKLGLWGLDVNWSKSLNWMASAGKLSKATNP
jgi:antiviral helicase SLH1